MTTNPPVSPSPSGAAPPGLFSHPTWASARKDMVGTQPGFVEAVVHHRRGGEVSREVLDSGAKRQAFSVMGILVARVREHDTCL